MERRIIREIKKDPFQTSLKMAKDVNMGLPEESQIKPRTLRFYALKNKFRCFRPAIKPKLSPKQIRIRLEFAKKYKDKDMRFWSRVLFSDETQVLLKSCGIKLEDLSTEGLILIISAKSQSMGEEQQCFGAVLFSMEQDTFFQLEVL